MTSNNCIKLSLTETPCKKCKSRYPACHDTCEKYQAWRVEEKKCQLKNNIFKYNTNGWNSGWSYTHKKERKR